MMRLRYRYDFLVVRLLGVSGCLLSGIDGVFLHLSLCCCTLGFALAVLKEGVPRLGGHRLLAVMLRFRRSHWHNAFMVMLAFGGSFCCGFSLVDGFLLHLCL